MCSNIRKYALTHKTFWIDRHVPYLASKIFLVNEDISAMMISSRLKKDNYEAHSVAAPAGKYAGASWAELGMLNFLALPAHKRKNFPALLAPKKSSKS